MDVKKIGKNAMMVVACMIGILTLIPDITLAATSNEQVLAGYSLDPGQGLDAKQSAIDSIADYIVAVFSREVTDGGVWNIYAVKSTNGGVSWTTGSPVRICQSDNDQFHPDVKLMNVDGTNLIAFVVWQEESDGQLIIRSKAVTFSNLNNAWSTYGTGGIKLVTTSGGLYQYPRIAGTDIYYQSTYYNSIFIVWQSGSNSIIEMIDFCDQRAIRWSDRYTIVSGDDEYEHPSIDAGELQIKENTVLTEVKSLIGLTYDICSTNYQVGFKRIPMTKTGGMEAITTTTMNFDTQDDPFYPDIIVSESIWDDPISYRWSKIYVAAQCLDDENNEINCVANDYGGDSMNWYGPYTAGSMESTIPSLRGVAIDGMLPGSYVKVIWVVSDNTYSEIRTDFFIYDSSVPGFLQCPKTPFPYYDWGLVDSDGNPGGTLSCVAISASNGVYHCLYNRANIDVVYYTWTVV